MLIFFFLSKVPPSALYGKILLEMKMCDTTINIAGITKGTWKNLVSSYTELNSGAN